MQGGAHRKVFAQAINGVKRVTIHWQHNKFAIVE
jgi:hypothetical protein